MLNLRIDVDYPFLSRTKSFFCVMLGIKGIKNKHYLENAHIIANLINSSPKEVKAYWFFTPYTIPDKKLLKLLNSPKHEVGLHVVNDPVKELEALQKATERQIKNHVLSMHPEWLLKKNKKTHRGPDYNVLKNILGNK